MNKQQLATKIWESANKMRSKIEANDYKDYILGFIFYKFLSDTELRYLRSQGASDAELEEALTEEDQGLVGELQQSVGYFIAHEHLFSTWIEKGSDFDVADVRDALSAFSRLIGPSYKHVFEGIFATLQTGLSKLGENAASQTKAVRDLIYLIKDIPMGGRQDYDVLGFIYEYLISNFAANAGKKAGEFYTPHEVSLLMSRIVADHLHDRREISIYDPTSGSGSLLLNIGDAVARHMDDSDRIKYFAQELKQNTYNLTRMNLVMRGIKPANIVTRNADTLESDWPLFDERDPIGTYNLLRVDAVVSNPPYSQAWDPENKASDPRYSRFGLAPKSKADYAFLLHDLYHLKPDGIMTIILPHGVLFRGGEEGAIRRNLIEQNHIDAIIGLPANIFFGTGIPTIIVVLKQQRSDTDVLVVDASRGFAKDGKNNVLRARDIKRIVDTVADRRDVPKFARAVSREEIRENDYNLNIPRYVDSADAAESWDIYASMFGGVPGRELDLLENYWRALPGVKEALFTEQGGGYWRLSDAAVENPGSVISAHSAVRAFAESFARAFEGFDAELVSRLVKDRSQVSAVKEESVIAGQIFDRMRDVPLIDRYQAYQLLHDQWNRISLDLEMIQTEGSEALRKVEPNLVAKKRGGKDVEVQEGWAGRIMAFELVQRTLLAEQSAELQSAHDQLATAGARLQEVLDEMSEEVKADLGEVLNDDNSAFVPAMLARAVKEVRKGGSLEQWPEASAERAILTAAKLLDEERTLKRRIKTSADDLQSLTKHTIEQLTDEAAEQLLAAKWIEPLIEGISKLPGSAIADLTARVVALAKKYETTFDELEREIAETETELLGMFEQLTGSETDMQALACFGDLLRGSSHD